jgi:hypothetical protein
MVARVKAKGMACSRKKQASAKAGGLFFRKIPGCRKFLLESNVIH